MLNSEEGCIRYLMREMDPSEEVEFEREMMQDENLLIEVESLRSTYKKLGKLPLKTPPRHISEKVLADAVAIQKKEIRRNSLIVGWLGKSVAAAAVVILSVSTGYHFMTEHSDADPSTTNSTQVVRSSMVQPWVDRNQVISISDNQNAGRSQLLDEAYSDSYNKLILVEDGPGVTTSGQRVLLTNSPSDQ